jgi:dephospho-CoA kinase
MGMTASVALTAERGTGKTTLGAAAAVALDAAHVRVSSWLAHRLAEVGHTPTAGALREAGELAAADPRALVADVLAHHDWRPGRAFVFDAVRHEEVLTALREHVAPQPVLHVALVLHPRSLANRLADRGDADEVSAGAGHSTEAQVPSLVAAADLVLDATLGVDVLVEQLRRACQALR